MSHWSHLSCGLPVCFPSQGTQVQIPRGVLMWNRDSPVSVVSLHWWPRHDWSSWPCLRRASSQTITRPSCRQCDNPSWSHTAFLSRFHARCRSPFQLHNRRSWLLGGSPVESLQSLHSHHVSLVQWTTCLLPVTRNPGSNHQGGTYVKPGFSCYRCIATGPWLGGGGGTAGYGPWNHPVKESSNKKSIPRAMRLPYNTLIRLYNLKRRRVLR